MKSTVEMYPVTFNDFTVALGDIKSVTKSSEAGHDGLGCWINTNRTSIPCSLMYSEAIKIWRVAIGSATQL